MQRSLMATMVLIILSSVSLHAQITIPTNPFNPPTGTVLRSASGEIEESFYITVTSGSGGGHLWDFSSIVLGEEDSSHVVSCASAPAADSFPTANLCWMAVTEGSEEDSLWFYSASNPSSFLGLGMLMRVLGMEDIVTVYENTAPDYVFPIAMGNSWVAHRHWTQTLSPTIEIYAADSTFYNVDAWGQLKYGSIAGDCLRIMSTERVSSTTIVSGVPIGTTVTETERYDYVIAGSLDALSVSKTVTPLGTFYGVAANLNSLETGLCCEVRGDFNHDGIVDVSDVVAWVDWAFSIPQGSAPGCDEAGYHAEIDCNNDDIIDVSDIVYWIDWSYSIPQGPAPVPCP